MSLIWQVIKSIQIVWDMYKLVMSWIDRDRALQAQKRAEMRKEATDAVAMAKTEEELRKAVSDLARHSR